MTVKLLLDVDVDEDFEQSLGPRPSKRLLAEAIADRLMLNEIGNADFYMLKEVKGRFIAYGEPF